MMTQQLPGLLPSACSARVQLVVMPYTVLLSRETRAALGIRLEGAVVIVDEAHNIVEAINAVHSKRVTLSEVCFCPFL